MLDSVTALNRPPEDMPTPTRHNHHSQVRLKLPPIQIHAFDGSYHLWLPFKELFEAIIDLDERSEASFPGMVHVDKPLQQ